MFPVLEDDMLHTTLISRLAVTYGTPPLLLAAYGGCFLVKKCAELAYSKKKRAMLAGDMVLEIHTVFQTILEPQDGDTK